MDELMRLLIFACLLFWPQVFAAPLQTHFSGGYEHIVIVDRNHPTPPSVTEVLNRLALNESHPDVKHVYNNSAFHGFAASMKSHCLDLLANMTDVSIVEKATTVSHASLPYETRPRSPWGLQQISTSSSVTGSPEQMDYLYSYSTSSLGHGTDIYIIDTGISTTHTVFNGRAKMIWPINGDTTDLDGHGTHVSGTAAGAILGVASNANIWGLKALGTDGGGMSSTVIAAIDYAIKTHSERKNLPSFLGSVISMSLASNGPVQAIDTAIRAATAAGVHTVVAAGNDHTDACSTSPSSSGGSNGPAITVGAASISGSIASFSNTGSCVDVYAPGEGVISAWIGGPNTINSLSGTSMATPHVTGIVACAMANVTLAGDPGLMKEWVVMQAVAMQGGGSGSGSGEGVLLANNGVRADTGEGMLGLEKIGARPAFVRAVDDGAGLGKILRRGVGRRVVGFLGLIEEGAKLRAASWLGV